MLGNLGENLTNTMKKLVGMSVIDKKTIKELVKDIQRALIQSDVNIKLVLDLSKKIETSIEKRYLHPTFNVALFTKIRKPPKCPSVYEWMN